MHEIKEADIVVHTRVPQKGPSPYTPSASVYKIADIFKNVNFADEDLLKKIQDGFLNKEQLDVKKDGTSLFKTEAGNAGELRNEVPSGNNISRRNDYGNTQIQSRDSSIAAHPEQWNAERMKEDKVESAIPLSEIIAKLKNLSGLYIDICKESVHMHAKTEYPAALSESKKVQ